MCEWKLLPDGVKHRRVLLHAKDLWQLGMLIKAAAVCADVAIISYADRLLTWGVCHCSLSTQWL